MIRRLLAIPVIALFATLILGAHWYVVERLVLAPGWPAPVQTAAVGVVILLAASLIAGPVTERLATPAVARLVIWPSSIWMGFGFLLLMALGFSDLIVLLLGALAEPHQQLGLARFRTVAVLAVVIPVALIALRNGGLPPAVNRVRIGLARWPNDLRPLRIVQITDIHMSATRGVDFARWLVARTNALEPDLIAVTGDLVDGRVDHLRPAVAPFADLSAELGVYFVTGNHDHYSGGNEWAEEAARLGMHVLRNEHHTLHIRGHKIELAGVDDHRANLMPGEDGEDLTRALDGCDPTLPLILLAHDPSTFRKARKLGVDLQISGHTHGGQIWPFQWFVRLAVPWVAGLHRSGPAQLWVSRGTGSWGPPMRLGAPAEITELSVGSDLRGPNSASSV